MLCTGGQPLKAPKKKEPITDEEKFQAALQSEYELARLQRQYTLLERDRREFTGGTSSKNEKQRKVLSIFEHEHENILNDLMVATSGVKEREDRRNSNQLAALLDEYNDFIEQIKTKKTHIKEIQGQIKIMKKNVQEVKKTMITDRMWFERIKNASNYVETLENKLEVQMRKFGTICSQNRQLREEIDHMLYERASFLKIWDKLILNLNIGKKFMLDLIEQATIAYDQREEWCSKLQALRMKAHQDLLRNTQQMREYKRQQDDYKKLEDFFGVKGQKRLMLDLERKEKEKRAEHRKKSEEQLAKYEGMIASIVDFTGGDSIASIIKKYIRQEEENFTLFKFINDLIKEMEFIGDALAFLHVDIDQKRALHEARAEQQKNRLEEIEEQLREAKEATAASRTSLKEADDTLAKMIHGIEGLSRAIHCNTDPLLRLLGDQSKIHNYNVLLHVHLIEQRVHEMLLHVYHTDKSQYDKRKIKGDQRIIREDKIKPTLFVIEEVAQSNPCPLCVEHEQVSDVIDVLQHVWSRDDTKLKLKARLELPDGMERVHNVSACHLPKSRQIIQKRYQ